MPTDKHIDITSVLQSNVNSNLTTFIFGCLKKLSRTIVHSKENCLGVIVSVSNQFLIQKNLRDIPGGNQGRYKAYSPTRATLGELTFLHLRLTGPLGKGETIRGCASAVVSFWLGQKEPTLYASHIRAR